MPDLDINGRRIITVGMLAHDLRALGVTEGMTLFVHSALKPLGWVCGGPHAVILALLDALGPTGTLAMPAHSPILTDPVRWCNPPVPESWWPIIKSEMPAFAKDLTPTGFMGRIAETFRKMEGVLRSDHPCVSVCAFGPNAERITGSHALPYGNGDGSPIARLYDLDASILLLAVDHGSNTSMHLAEYRARFDARREITQGAPIIVDGARRWVEYPEILTDDDGDCFVDIGKRMEETTDIVSIGPTGEATSRLMRVRPTVDFAVEWLENFRDEWIEE